MNIKHKYTLSENEISKYHLHVPKISSLFACDETCCVFPKL
jgi:hypothetical protein